MTEKYTNHEDLPASGYKLMIEERGKSVVLENTLSGGLCGTITASGGSCDRRNRHSVTDVGEMATT